MPQVPIYLDQGGALQHVSSGGELDIETGGIIDVQDGAQLKIKSTAVPTAATLSPAAGSANVSLVTIQAQDNAGNNIAKVVPMLVWLSDAATGAGLTATTASGAVGAGASGTDIGTLTAKKALQVLTDANGKYILSITDTAKTGFYVCAQLPVAGKPQISAQLVAGNYG